MATALADGSVGPVALVTGASRGLGRALATFLGRSSYALVLTARERGPLREVAAEIARGRDVVALDGDVTDPQHRREAIAAAAGLGGLDLLVHNASTLGASPRPDLLDAPEEVVRRAWDVNVLAPIDWTREALPLLRSRGLVVSVTSDAAVGAYAGWGVYGMTKAALELASRTLAEELRPQRVGVVLVDPGDMRTRMQQEAYPGEDVSDRPEPEVTLPFWAWLLGRPPMVVSGGRYQAQGDGWADVSPEEAPDLGVVVAR